MKKLFTLILALAGYVGTAGAWGTFYLNCDDNSWGSGVSLPFTCKATNSYYYVLSGDHVNNGDFYFRFYVAWDIGDGGNYVMPNSDGDVVSSDEVYTTNVIWDSDDSNRAFKIEQNASAKAVILYIYYENDEFKLQTEVLTSSSTVAFVNSESWSNVYVYAYDNRDPEIKVKGAWPGTQIGTTDGVYRVEIPYSNTTKVIFNNGGSNQTANLDLGDDYLYNTDGKVANQSVSVSSYGMSTFSSAYPLDFSDVSGLTAYRITGVGDNSVLNKEAVTKVPANTGLYIEGTASTNFSVPATATATALGTNLLVPGTGVSISQTDGTNTNFILTVNKKGGGTADTPRFYKVNSAGNTVDAGKAYLQIPTATASREFFWFDDDPAGVEAVASDKQAVEGQAYNLAGQRVAQPTRGLYIVNGKKVILK